MHIVQIHCQLKDTELSTKKNQQQPNLRSIDFFFGPITKDWMHSSVLTGTTQYEAKCLSWKHWAAQMTFNELNSFEQCIVVQQQSSVNFN